MMHAILLLMFPYVPHRACLLDNWWLIAVDVLSDGLIGVSFFMIARMLLFVGRRADRFARLLGFIAAKGSWVLRLFVVQFGLFILACGASHFVNVWTMWQPVYTLDAAVRVVTAILSVRTVIAIARLTIEFMAQERQVHQ